MNKAYRILGFRAQAALWSSGALLLAACGGGDVVKIEPAQKSERYFADKAITQLQAAKSSSERDAVFAAIETAVPEKRPSWAVFWEQVSTTSMTREWADADRQRLLKLHELSCRDEDFRAFADFLLFQKGPLDSLIPPLRYCQNPLGPTLTGKVLVRLYTDYQDAQKSSRQKARKIIGELCRFYLLEFNLNRSAEWKIAARSLGGMQWLEVLRVAQELEGGRYLEPLLSSHELYNGDTLALEALSFALLRDRKSLQSFVDKMGFAKTLQVLAEAPKSQIDEVDTETLIRTLTAMSESYKVPQGAVLANNWNEAWQGMVRYRQFASRVEHRVPLSLLLSQLENMQRRFELDMRKDVESARDFFRRFSGYSGFDFEWVKLRVLGEADALTTVVVQGLPSRVDKAIELRLRARKAKTMLERHDAILELCRYFEQEGIASHELGEKEFRDRLALNLGPGCYRMKNFSGARIEAVRVEMPFDAIILAPEQSLEITADHFDGSFFDLSSDQAPMMPVTALPTARSALVFPILFGLHSKIPRPIPQAGISRIWPIVMHFPYRRASDGQATAQPGPGRNGGNFKLKILQSSAKPEDFSFRPLVASQGSAGQAAAPAEAGGRGAESKIGLERAQSWRVAFNYKFLGPKTARVEAPATRSQLRELLKYSQRGSGEGEIFIDEHFLNDLSPAELEAFDLACDEKSNERDPAYRRKLCLEKFFAPVAVKMLEAALYKNDFIDESNVKDLWLPSVLDVGRPYKVPAGHDGPRSPNGPPGSSGTITVEGVSP